MSLQALSGGFFLNRSAGTELAPESTPLFLQSGTDP